MQAFDGTGPTIEWKTVFSSPRTGEKSTAGSLSAVRQTCSEIDDQGAAVEDVIRDVRCGAEAQYSGPFFQMFEATEHSSLPLRV